MSKCCLLFASKGVGTGAIRFGISVVVGVERSVLQSFQSNNSFEKTWGKGGRPGVYEGFVGVSFCVGVGLQKCKRPATAAGRIAGRGV